MLYSVDFHTHGSEYISIFIYGVPWNPLSAPLINPYELLINVWLCYESITQKVIFRMSILIWEIVIFAFVARTKKNLSKWIYFQLQNRKFGLEFWHLKFGRRVDGFYSTSGGYGDYVLICYILYEVVISLYIYISYFTRFAKFEQLFSCSLYIYSENNRPYNVLWYVDWSNKTIASQPGAPFTNVG